MNCQIPANLKPVPSYFNRYFNFSTNEYSHRELWNRLMAFFACEPTPEDGKMTWQRYYVTNSETNQIFCLVEEQWTAFALVVITLFDCKGPESQELLLPEKHQGILVEFQRREGCRDVAWRFQRRVRAHVLHTREPVQTSHATMTGENKHQQHSFPIQDREEPSTNLVAATRSHLENLLAMSESNFVKHQREGVTGLVSIACNDSGVCFATLCSDKFRDSLLSVCKVTLAFSADVQTQRAVIGLMLNLSAQDTRFMHALRSELNACNFLQEYLHTLCTSEARRGDASAELTTRSLAHGVQIIFDLLS